MYGYSSPRQPDFASCRVLVNEHEIRQFMGRFPALTREEVIAALVAGKPDFTRVEQMLRRLSADAPRARGANP